jgi:hypothetical protein
MSLWRASQATIMSVVDGARRVWPPWRYQRRSNRSSGCVDRHDGGSVIESAKARSETLGARKKIQIALSP